MDFTYFIAGFIAVVVGFVAGIVFVIIKGRSKLRLVAVATSTAVALDAALLISWAHLSDAPAWLVVVDFLFFAVYGVVGSAIGVAPALLARLVWRNRPRQGRKAARSS